ncbi:helix-turn-helix domain-containing protein [Stigmatella aurantiaca]|nr:AraC family transcriptional regulator [Stigmatella aurantiaca]
MQLGRQGVGIGRAIDWLTAHFKQPLKMGPLQYQKHLRLEEARRLRLGGLADSTGAAFAVDYESPSQFIREYRRRFGLPPLRDVKSMRDTAAPRADV